MKKKVLYGVFMALLAFAAIGTLQSCKDDVSDLRTQTTYDVANLKSQLSAVKDNLQQQITANKNKADKNEQDIAQLRQDLAQYATISYVDGLIGDKSQIPAGGLVEMITGALSRIDGLENALGTENDPVTANTVYGKLNALKAGLDAIETELGELDTQMQELSTKVDGLIQDFDALKADVDDLAEKVDAIENAFDEITGRLDALVTGVLIQGTDNPLFGNFSLPIGVKSNMLFQWYGTNEWGESYEFPDFTTDHNVDDRFLCDYAAGEILGAKTITIPASGYYGLGTDDCISLGKLYLTVNPTDVDFSNTAFKLETSDGQSLPFLAQVIKSNDRLTFGYTSRADEAVASNGFYESDVLMPKTEEAIAKTKIDIEESLITSIGAALKDPSKRTAATLLKSLYDAMAGKLPAYAVRYDWNYTWNGATKPAAVLSQYDLAVATAQPLGYNFMKDKSFNHKLPTIGHIQNYLDRIKDKLDNKLNVGMNITVDGKEVKMQSLDVKEADGGGLDVSAVGLTVGGKELTAPGRASAPEGVMAAATEAICKAIIEEVYGTTATDAQKGGVYASVTAELLVLQAQLNSVLDDVTGSVERLTDGVYDKVMAHKDRINQMFDLYNRVANKISRILKYPNDYLQVAAYYASKDNVNILSCEPESPTQFKGEGNYITLYLSSYNGELIVPAYKKYVAITEVNGSHDGIKELNEGGDLNKVLDGTRIRVAIPTGKLRAGNTYEITYQAVDYRGWISTRRFYIKVN